MDEIKAQLTNVNRSNAELKSAVQGLSRQLTVTKDQTKELHKQAFRTRVLTVVAAVLAVLALSTGGFSYYLLHQIHITQKLSCEQGNQRAEGSRKGWNFLVDISEGSPGNKAPKYHKALEDVRAYYNELYAQRDCNDLKKKYTYPTPPPILDEINKKS